MSAASTAVLLLAHGSPEDLSDVPEFLRNVTGGRTLPVQIVEEVEHRYALIGRSPLTEITFRQAEALSHELRMPVYVGMRNWKPYIADTVRQMEEAGIEHSIAVCLAPQNSRTSVGMYRSALSAADPGFAVDFVEQWHDDRLLARAFAEKLLDGWRRACGEAGARIPVIFTAHSVPTRTIAEGDPYERQAKVTAALVADAAGLRGEDWRFAFQSQGTASGTWLGPTVEETILTLKALGYAGVFIDPIGFVSDHVEVLYDIDIAFREFAEAHSMRLWRAESLNDSPAFIKALAGVVRDRMTQAQPAERS